MAKLRASATTRACAQALDALRDGGARNARTCSRTFSNARARYCTLYEIRAAMEDVFGAYREPVFF